MGRPPGGPTLAAAVQLIDRTERDLRKIIAHWDGLPPEVQRELTQIRAAITKPANRALRFLIRCGRR